MILQPGVGLIRAEAYLPAEPATLLWGRLPCADDAPLLSVEPGTEVTFDTVSHEGLLEDQGRDPRREHGSPCPGRPVGLPCSARAAVLGGSGAGTSGHR